MKKDLVLIFGIFLVLNFGAVGVIANSVYNYSVEWIYETNGSASSVSISSNGNYIAVGTSKGIYFLDHEKNLLWYNETIHPIIDVSMTADANYTVAGGSSGYYWGGVAYFFNRMGEFEGTVTASTGISSVMLSPEGNYFAMTYDNGLGWNDRVVLAGEGQWLWYKDFGRSETADVSISKEATYIAVGGAADVFGNNGGVVLFGKNGNHLWEYEIDISALSGDKYSIAISSDGKYIAAGNEDNNNLYFFDRDQKLLWNYSIGYVKGVDIPSDGNFIVVASKNKVYLFDHYKNILWTSNISDIEDVSISDDANTIVVLTKSKLYAFSSSQQTCSDGIKNGDETDVDCGGSCPSCENGKSCLQKADCLSGYCNPNKICSVPSCNDGWKNGDESGVDCGGSCSACQPIPSCSNGIQNGYEEGIDCGGLCVECDYKLTILIIPVNWQGSYNSFKGTALAVSKYFLNRIPLKDCPNEYKLLISDEIDYDGERVLWDGWKCYIPEYSPGCFVNADMVLKIIEHCAKRYGDVTGRKYDYIAGITDLEKIGGEHYTDILGNIKCKNQAAGWTMYESNAVISTTFDTATVSHELGHQLGFGEQYCDCSGVIYEGFNLGNICGPNAPINPLNKTLGCDYDSDCCWMSSRELYPGCYKQCKGNFDRFGEDTNNDGILDSEYRSIMSALVPRNHYDINEYTYLDNHFQCSGIHSLSANTFSQELITILPVNDSILKISLKVSKNDTVAIDYMDVISGESLLLPSITGNYSLKVLDENNTTLYERDFPLYFFMLSDSPIITNYSAVYDRIRYKTSMRKIQLYHNENLIFEQEINFCNFDGRCDSNENYYSCPYDCESWASDGICNNDLDGVCDFDCLSCIDPDCLAGDTNIDAIVNIFDLAKVGLCYGQAGSGNCANADLNSDGKVNIFDLATVGLNYGKSC